MASEQDSLLGKSVAYCDTYSPDLLFPIKRAQKRREIGVDETKLPFHGVDIWNAFEISWLNTKGKPVVAIGEIVVPGDSPCLIESKSLKLYFNSFNQTRFESDEAVAEVMQRDLTKAAGAPVGVTLIPASNFSELTLGSLPGDCIDDLDVEIDLYSVDPTLLTVESEASCEECLTSDLLKSNCLVTGQPDWGSVMIHYVGPKIDHAGLLKYLISFRQHNEFHEQCIERIFVDITERCHPEKLTVYGRYTRRGGLDINPFRSNWQDSFENNRLARQ